MRNELPPPPPSSAPTVILWRESLEAVVVGHTGLSHTRLAIEGTQVQIEVPADMVPEGSRSIGSRTRLNIGLFTHPRVTPLAESWDDETTAQGMTLPPLPVEPPARHSDVAPRKAV